MNLADNSDANCEVPLLLYFSEVLTDITINNN